jgi:hypothetical protein
MVVIRRGEQDGIGRQNLPLEFEHDRWHRLFSVLIEDRNAMEFNQIQHCAVWHQFRPGLEC